MSLIFFRISNSDISVRNSGVGIEFVTRSGAHGYRAEIQEKHEYHEVDSFGRRKYCEMGIVSAVRHQTMKSRGFARFDLKCDSNCEFRRIYRKNRFMMHASK